MRIVFGADDENETTRAVTGYLSGLGEVLRVGTDEPWPGIGAEVGRAVAQGRADAGVVMCWTGTGTGTAIAANKVPGYAPRWPGIHGSRRGPGSGTTRTYSR